jgi:hypothetical protein
MRVWLVRVVGLLAKAMTNTDPVGMRVWSGRVLFGVAWGVGVVVPASTGIRLAANGSQ